MASGGASILVLGVLLLLVVVVVVVLAYSFVATQESQSYPAPAVQIFLDQCARVGGDEQTCSCMITEMQQQYTLDQLIRFGLRAQNTGQIPDELSDALARCSP